MPKRTKQERANNERINAAFNRTCSGIQINIMDLSKIFKHGITAIARGEDDAALGATIRAYVETIRQN